MANILVICPTQRDRRELVFAHVQKDHSFIFHNYEDTGFERIIAQGIGLLSKSFDPEYVIEKMLLLCKDRNIDGVMSSEDYPGSVFASVINKNLGLYGADPEIVLRCQHKYYSRCDQLKYVPEATTRFFLIDPYSRNIKSCALQFPVFIKPIKSFFSFYANQANSKEELDFFVRSCVLPKEFLHQFNWFLKHYSSCKIDARYLLVEELLSGIQVTVEGFVHNNEVTIMGITDSVMFPGTISFKRFDYPSCLPELVQKRMSVITSCFVRGVGLNNTMFNIEMMYSERKDEIKIIEVNPRMASQFADLYEKVDGYNSYSVLIDLALGKRPTIQKNKGRFACAASFVLRVFEDKKVVQVPTEEDLTCVHQAFPESRVQIFVQPGQKLSDTFQDGKSFRYGLIHLGGTTKQDLLDRYNRCMRLLPFKFLPLAS